jgi:hypothetical protein
MNHTLSLAAPDPVDNVAFIPPTTGKRFAIVLAGFLFLAAFVIAPTAACKAADQNRVAPADKQAADLSKLAEKQAAELKQLTESKPRSTLS